MSGIEYLNKIKSELPIDKQDKLAVLGNNYEKRWVLLFAHIFILNFWVCSLYHQLTLNLKDLLKDEDFSKYLIDLWYKFIVIVKDKLNQLRLTEIGVRVAQEMDPQSSLTFLESLLNSLPIPLSALPPSLKPDSIKPFDDVKPPTKTECEAYVLARISIAHYDLLLGNLDKTKEAMDVCERVLDSLDGVEASVTGAWLRVSGDYFKSKAEYAPFYRTTLLYISCAGLDQLERSEQIQRSHDLAIAALLGDTIYNFGELLTHPVLNALNGTQLEWLKDLIYVFNQGDISTFETSTAQLSQEPLLYESQPFLRQKICLMALIECVFKRPSHDRVMSFSTIGNETKLPIDEVEHLIMKALS